MKAESFTKKFTREKKRAQFLFNDGEFKPRTEFSAKVYRRREKHINKSVKVLYFTDSII